MGLHTGIHIERDKCVRPSTKERCSIY